jgi:hypothetical protein
VFASASVSNSAVFRRHEIKPIFDNAKNYGVVAESLIFPPSAAAYKIS